MQKNLDDVKLGASKETNTVVKTDQSVTSTPKDELNPPVISPVENTLGIKIKEITKPEEIRITDDKPKIFKPTKSTVSRQETTESSTLPIDDGIDMTSTTQKSFIEDTNLSTENVEKVNNENVSTEDVSNSPVPSTTESNVNELIELEHTDINTIGDELSNKSVRQAVGNTNETNNTFHKGDADVTPLYAATTDSSSERNEISNSNEQMSTSTEDITFASSTIRPEASDEKQTVVQVSDDVVIVHHSGQTKSITVIGAAGLQRGEDTENENRHDSDGLRTSTENTLEDSSSSSSQSPQPDEQSTVNSVSIPNELIESTTLSENLDVLDGTLNSPELVSSEIFGDNSAVVRDSPTEKMTNAVHKLNESNDNEHSTINNSLEVISFGDVSTEDSGEITAASDQVFETVLHHTTTGPLKSIVYETTYYGTTVDSIEGSSSPFDDDILSSSSEFSFTTEGPRILEESSSTTASSFESSSRYATEDYDDNPEFPHIPDDLSIHGRMEEDELKRPLSNKVIAEEISSTTIGPRPLDISAGTVKNENSILKISSTEGPPSLDVTSDNVEKETLILEISSTAGPPSLDEIKKVHEHDMILERSPGEPHLIPEWERNTTVIDESTTAINNDVKNVTQMVNGTEIIEEISFINGTKAEINGTLNEKLTNELNSDESYGKKEPTTERSTTTNYEQSSSELSESVSSEGFYPKEDAESIKAVDPVNYESSSNLFQANAMHFFGFKLFE